MFSRLFLVFILIGFVSPKTAIGFDDTEEIKSNKFKVPKAASFFSGDYLKDKSPDALKTLYAQGLMKLILSPPEAMQIFVEGARHGYAPSMLSLGNNAQDLTEKLHYYILAFETHWEQTGEQYKPALTAMNKLGTNSAQTFSFYSKQTYADRSDQSLFNIACLYANSFQKISLTFEDAERKAQKFLKQIQEKFLCGYRFFQCYENPLHSQLTKKLFLNFSAFLYQQSKTPDATCNLGGLYIDGHLGQELSESTRYKVAERFFEESGSPDAKYNLGSMYLNRHLGRELSEEERYQKVEKYFEESGTPTAKYNLGVMYNGRLLGKDLSIEERYQKAGIFFKQAGTPDAQFNLGIMYRDGTFGRNPDGEPDYQTAHDCFIALGTPEAKGCLAEMYCFGQLGQELSEDERYKEAERLFVKSGSPDAKYKRGLMYCKGQLGQELSERARYKEAERLLKESGTTDAKYSLGKMYYEGNLEQDLPKGWRYLKAKEYFEQSGTPKAICVLGIMYLNGHLGQELTKEKRYQKAKELFEQSRIPEAQESLGRMYYYGQVGQELSEGERYQKAGEFFEQLGTSFAKCKLGYMYHQRELGQELSEQERYQKAKELFEESENPIAKFNLGIMYLRGYISPNMSEQELYQRLEILFSESGTPEAEYNLGILYLKTESESTELERHQKALDHLTSAFLRGIVQAKTIISDLRELIKIEKKRLTKADASQEEHSNVATSSHYVDGFQEDHKEEIRAVPYVKTKQSKISREERIQQLKDEIAKAKIISSLNTTQQTQTFPIRFASEKVRKDFESMQGDPHYMNKITELIAAIHQDPRGTQDSTGQCEPLKNHRNHYSRRINQKDRLVYIFDGMQVIMVSCKGHYNDLK